MGVQLKDEQVKNQKNSKNRRRKKRRTEDFSSDSSNSSSSESESEDKVDSKDQISTKNNGKTDSAQPNIPDVNLDGINFDQINSSQQQLHHPVISRETKLKLENINIASNNNNISRLNKEELLKISQQLKKEEQDLQNEFLIKMMKEYDSDIDELRVKPDFALKSLPLLAKVLKNGANLFDNDTLNSVLKE